MNSINFWHPTNSSKNPQTQASGPESAAQAAVQPLSITRPTDIWHRLQKLLWGWQPVVPLFLTQSYPEPQRQSWQDCSRKKKAISDTHRAYSMCHRHSKRLITRMRPVSGSFRENWQQKEGRTVRTIRTTSKASGL
jgi:hypothetical protein